MAETAALVGLGRRGCAVVRQLQQALDIPSRAFLLDDEHVVLLAICLIGNLPINKEFFESAVKMG
jgi:hypothetical protein